MRICMKKRYLICVVFTIAAFIFLHPDLNARRSYEYIATQDVLYNLHEETAQNFSSSAIFECDYKDLVYDRTSMAITIVDGDLYEGHRIKDGGEYSPQDCKPKFSTAIIVPYRDSPEQLRGFLVYMHTFFRRQKIHYRLFIVEQVDSRPYNRAKLLNIGAMAAIGAGFPCLILHDLHLLPLKVANIYACTELPRRMSSSVDKFRFVLPHLNLFDGAIAITSRQYRMVNGMSNMFFGVGGEDDDFYNRLQALDIKVCRFDPETSDYHMVKHKDRTKGVRTNNHIGYKSKVSTDGLTSLKFTEIGTVYHPLFTHIMVDL